MNGDSEGDGFGFFLSCENKAFFSDMSYLLPLCLEGPGLPKIPQLKHKERCLPSSPVPKHGQIKQILVTTEEFSFQTQESLRAQAGKQQGNTVEGNQLPGGI